MKEIFSLERGHSIVKQFANAKVLVVGDLIMDHFIWGDVKRISPEAPVPVVAVKTESLMLGGSANVVNNICSLGGKALICGIIGKDRDGKNLLRELKVRGIPTEGVIVEKGRPTTTKTRVIAHNQQVVRFDKELKDNISTETTSAIISYLKKAVALADVIVISDYSKGLITKDLVKRIVTLAKKSNKTVIVDPKETNTDFYKGVTLVTPNNREASQVAGITIDTEDALIKAGRILLKRFASHAVLITRGEHGMSLFEKRKSVYQIPTIAKEVYDVSGAGDTVVAVMALAIALGSSIREAAVLANFAAGIVVGKLGTATVGATELIKIITDTLK